MTKTLDNKFQSDSKYKSWGQHLEIIKNVRILSTTSAVTANSLYIIKQFYIFQIASLHFLRPKWDRGKEQFGEVMYTTYPNSSINPCSTLSVPLSLTALTQHNNPILKELPIHGCNLHQARLRFIIPANCSISLLSCCYQSSSTFYPSPGSKWSS